MERLAGVHLKWYQRHMSHMAEAFEAAERGDLTEACYHSYHAVAALAKGILGLDPYAPSPLVKTLPSMIREIDEETPSELMRCAKLLEEKYGKDEEECVKCAEILTDYLHKFLNLAS
ncbi:MAG: HEPN domain-containing protein [Pyrobaculum sp.]